MISYIRYNPEGGVEIYNGRLEAEKLVISDIINAVAHRLNNIPERQTTMAYHLHCEETCFLVNLIYDFDKLEQYFETAGENLILNFCNKEFVSIYSIWFDKWVAFSKTAIFEKCRHIKFSNQIAAPLITLEKIAERPFSMSFFYMKIGRTFFGNELFYKYNDVAYCLPVKQLIDVMVNAGTIKKYVKGIVVTIDDENKKVNIEVSSRISAHGSHYREYSYLGYLDLKNFDFIIENHTEELN